jgi:DNA-binding beta-propeller fold protein YncE
MKRLVLVGLLLAALVPAASRAGACSPLNCSPSQFALGNGSLLAMRSTVDKPVRVLDLRTGKTLWRLPAGIVSGRTLVHKDGSLLTWYDAVRGARVHDAVLQARGNFALVGASQDGRTAVVARTQGKSTTFAIVTPKSERIVTLDGNKWRFDALNGDRLFLIHYLPKGYEIRVLHLRSGVLDAPLKDPNASSTIWGSPWSHVSSANGRFLYTLYVGSNGGSMVHVLDTRLGTARCIDLPGTGSWDKASTYALVVDPDGRHLWAISPGYGRVAHIDVTAHRVVDSYRFDAGSWNTNTTVAAMSPDGERIAITDAYHIAFVQLATRKVVAGPTHVALALGFAPDQSRLWVVGERSQVAALPAG